VVLGHVRVLLADLGEHAAPQLVAVDENVRLVHQCELLLGARACEFVGVADAALDAVARVDHELGGHLVG